MQINKNQNVHFASSDDKVDKGESELANRRKSNAISNSEKAQGILSSFNLHLDNTTEKYLKGKLCNPNLAYK